jgi:hypothetical protein
MARLMLPITFVLVAASIARGETISLIEEIPTGKCRQIAVTMKLAGDMIVVQNGKPASLKLIAAAEHRYREKLLEPNKVARYYDDARAVITVDGGANPRMLRPDRKLIVVQRPKDALICYSPAGGLMREELELVAEHFDAMALTGILPGKSVAIGETWKLDSPIVQALCSFDSIVNHDLTAKLIESNGGIATISIEGTAKGAELGAQATVKVVATAKFDSSKKLLTKLEWKQTDARDQGPASPAVNAETTVSIARDFVDEPTELSDMALVAVPKGFEIPEARTRLAVSDVKGRFVVSCSREWQLTGRTESQMVLRLIDGGEFVAQATITPWQAASPGQHLDPKTFREQMVASPGWRFEEALGEGEMPKQPNGKWAYRFAARGQMGEAEVVQVFYLVAGTRGEQVVVAVTFKPAMASKLGGRDAALLDGIEFTGKN